MAEKNGKMVSVFAFEKDTKNTIRFAEEVSSEHPPIMNTVYVQKWVLANLGIPLGEGGKVRVTVEAV